ncbi:hypothetical protein LIER_17200 [Lithospermum erythrorhizon]|uniref:RING-type E3 ubiquitin transferase n=1 Tax=Lithospermum erythrorhizon TaxID=34254 RepID=A0AAV3QEV2_LITER
MARTTTTLNNSQNNNGGLLPCPSIGLDIEKINSLPIFTHKLSENSDNGTTNSSNTSSSSTFSFMENECSICLGTFEDEEILKLMPECLHVFHSECVDKWLSSSSTCPLCRSSI